MQGEFFLKINKRADQNKAVLGGHFFSKLINVHARLFGTLEYLYIYILDRLSLSPGGRQFKAAELN